MDLLETIRVENGIAENLNLHLDRMRRSYYFLFKKKLPFDLINTVNNNVNQSSNGLQKCRVVYNKNLIGFKITDYKIPMIKSVRLVEDNSIDYKFKYENRSNINKLFDLRGNTDDVIIVKNGLITDSSYANLLFFDGDRWVTPEKPLLAGVQRQKLLDNKTIYCHNITPDNLKSFQKLRFINAMLRFEDEIDIEIDKIYL